MTWTATYQPDTELQDTGSVSAKWVDPEDPTHTFSFGPIRVDSKNSLPDFINDAKAALSASRQKSVRVNAIAAKITAALNA